MAQVPREKAIISKRFCLLPFEEWEEGLFDPSVSIEN
jgi:hypothetical protein